MATIIKEEVKQFVKDCIENSEQKIGHKVTHTELLSVIRLQLPSLELSSPKGKTTAFFTHSFTCQFPFPIGSATLNSPESNWAMTLSIASLTSAVSRSERSSQAFSIIDFITLI